MGAGRLSRMSAKASWDPYSGLVLVDCGSRGAEWGRMTDLEGLVHLRIAESSARLYIDHLERTATETESETSRAAMRALIDTTNAALQERGDLDPSEVKFSFSSLDDVAPHDLPAFLNQFQLGLGWDGARTLAMGTEAAGDPANPEGLAYECLQTTLILSGSPESVVKSLLSESKGWTPRHLPTEPWRPIHIHPNDFDQVQLSTPFHTWCNLARVVAPAQADWRTVMGVGANPGLGDLVYQIERSGLPAKRSSDGAVPVPERTDWLVDEVISEIRTTAQILLIHGFGNSSGWNRNDLRLINAFLGYEPRALTKLEWVKVTPGRGDWLWSRDAGDHRVVWTRALGWPWRDEYLAAVRQAIK